MKTTRQKKDNLFPLAKMINEFIKREESGPTVREVMNMAQIKSPSHAQKLICELVEMNFIKKIDGKARSICMSDNFTKICK